MISNRRTKLIISRLLTAVFLFVIISTTIYPAIPALASDVSGNEAEEESWEDALSDQDFVDSLSDKIAQYYTAIYNSYTDVCGASWDAISDIVDPNGAAQDYYDKYHSVVNYLNPFVQTYLINDFQPGINITPKQVRDNNTSVLNDIVKDFGNDLSNLLPESDSVFQNLPKQKYNKNGLIHFDFLPSYVNISLRPISQIPSGYTHDITDGYGFTGTYSWKYYYSTFTETHKFFRQFKNFRDDSVIFYRYGTNYTPSLHYINNDGTLASEDSSTYNSYRYAHKSHDNSVTFNTNNPESGYFNSSNCSSLILFGDIIFVHHTSFDCYFWDCSERKLYNLGKLSSNKYTDFNNNNIDTSIYVSYNNTYLIENSVDFNSYVDEISQVMIEVTENQQVSNQLLLELINTISQQNNNYVQNDDDTIEDFLNDLKDRLQETIEVHIDIPDISPDLGGIATALSALLNFLASIIRAIGDIVSTLLDGLFHLFVPTTDQWAELSLDFDTIMNPFRWIRGFLGEGVNAVSTCLFGSNVTDIPSGSDELETVNASVSATRGEPSEHSNSHANIVYDEETGAPKIPVHFSNSTSEYFSNIEDAYIIDMNWYAPYKPVGDMIVVAFCWILFIWRVIRDLPGIINGTSGITDNSPDSLSGEINKRSTWYRISGR